MESAVALSASLLAVVVALNVALTAGIVRRIRLAQVQLAPRLVDAGGPLPGHAVGRFQTGALDGSTISDESLAASVTLVGFFAARCRPSERLRDELLAAPPHLPMVAFIVDLTEPGIADQAAQQLAESLRAIARVAVAPADGPVFRAFGVTAYPSLVRLEQRRVAEVLR